MEALSDELRWSVHKFGGTSLADAARYRSAAEIVLAEGAGQVVVVSAMAGVTDALLDLTERARTRGDDYRERLAALCVQVDQVLGALPAGGSCDALRAELARDEQDLADVLRAVWLGRSCAEPTRDLVSGYGELWSARTLCATMRARGASTEWIDARDVLIVRHAETGPLVDWDASRRRLDAWRRDRPASFYVVTGYIAATADEVPTTLKRNGSDFSASIFGALFTAERITIWTDVDGVLSADPRRVPEAEVLDELSYDEAMELAYFGAKVLHPNTMAPAIEYGIPIWIRNSGNTAARGTRIAAAPMTTAPMTTAPMTTAPMTTAPIAAAPPDPDAGLGRTIRGLTTVDGVALIDVEGTGMIGVPGVARRLFGALERVGVSVILISQASSEHSICFAVPGADADRAVETVRGEFFTELHHGQIQTVDQVADCSIVAAVGDGMAAARGVAARFFGALAGAGVNVRAIAQGSSERNISAVVAAADSTRALRAVHSGFYLSRQTLSVGLIGPGSIGGTLLDQLAGQADALRERLQVELRVRAIASSTRMLLDPVAIDLGGWRERFDADAVPLDLEVFARHVHADHLPHAVLVDCTASEEIADRYVDWLGAGIHVVTPNKRAGSGPLQRLRAIEAGCRAGGTQLFCEATVGAGLPVISTLGDLIATGDRVRSIEGVLSGTLAFLFDAFDGATPFSRIVRDARARGYTEPDPRDDLSGMDVARKLVILARQVGVDLELDAVEVESLVPAELEDRGIDVDAFLDRFASVDGAMADRLAGARADGAVLRFVGSVDAAGNASVALRALPGEHPFAGAGGGDNVLAFRTARYDPQPLIVRGPGAGPAVTAGGVFADLLRLAATAGGGR